LLKQSVVGSTSARYFAENHGADDCNQRMVCARIDDICTNGYSLEAARAYIEQTGAKVVCMSWLKTINTEYKEIRAMRKFDPFVADTFTAEPQQMSHPYAGYVADRIAPEEVTQKLRAYDAWKWS